jgi:hypothetical protein
LIDADRTHLTCGAVAIGGGASASAESASGSGATTRFGVTGCSGASCAIVGVGRRWLAGGRRRLESGKLVRDAHPVRGNVAVPKPLDLHPHVFAAEASGYRRPRHRAVAVNVDLTATT